MKPTAFISYARADTELLDTVVLPVLESLGIAIEVDREFEPGTFWIEQVQQRIKIGDWLIPFLTERYQRSVKRRSGPCYNELRRIVDHVETARHPGKLVAILQHGQPPDLLRIHQAIDIRQNVSLLRLRLKSLLDAASEGLRVRQPFGYVQQTAPPKVVGPDQIHSLARHNFDSLASTYNQNQRAGNSMQAENTSTLLSALREALDRHQLTKPSSWLDAGCGTGLVADVVEKRYAEHDCRWLLKCEIRAGFDYAPGMIELLRNVSSKYTHAFEGDIRSITNEDLLNVLNVSSVELIIANSVLHWLFDESEIRAALKRCRSLLKDGGLFIASIAATGTGHHFQMAYRAEMLEALDYDAKARWSKHIENPIGLQPLERIVQIARNEGFAILTARQVYEPRRYLGGTSEYIDDARSYGDCIFMAPLLERSKEYQEVVWERILTRFTQYNEEAFHKREYVHDQYMIYLVARRFG